MSSAKILIRCDADSNVGFGHLRRCQALAHALGSLGTEIDWIVGTDLPSVLEQAGTVGRLLYTTQPSSNPTDEEACHLQSLAEGYDALILDHYALAEFADENFHIPWLRFDQGARTRPTSARWVHNALPGVSASEYEGIFSNTSAKLLLGPRFSILDPGFAVIRSDRTNDLIRRDEIEEVLLTFGGGDDCGLNLVAIEVVEAILPEARVTVLCTSANRSLPLLRNRAEGDGRLTLLVDSRSIYKVMKRVDLAICAGGTTLGELACLGVPALVTTVAPNQIRPAMLWEKAGCVEIVSNEMETFQEGLKKRLLNLLEYPGRLTQMSSVGLSLVDGLGAGRTSEAILS